MEWSLNKIWMCVAIIVGASVIGVALELVLYNQGSKPELSNNITIIVEVAVGFIIAIFVYGLTKIEKKKTDNEIKNIRDITARLEAVSYKIEKEQIVRTYENLRLLLFYNNQMSVLHNKIQNKSSRNRETMKDATSKLKLYYKLHAKTVDHTPVLHSDMNILVSSTTATHDNLDIYWTKNDWNNILAELEKIIGLRQKIEEQAKKEKEKLDELKSEYEGRSVQSE